MSGTRVSIIATTYNQPVDLDLYLTSLAGQTDSDFEVVIADDGSRADTKAVIDRHRAGSFGDRLKHVWHEDVGYRKCKILNSAIREASGEWMIFTDSDLIVHPKFIADHRAQARPNGLFMGRRVDLSSEFSEWVRAHRGFLFTIPFYLRLFRDGFIENRTKNLNRALRVGNTLIAKFLGMDRVTDLLGSNFSIDRKLLEAVNGFDEGLEHYWGEDGDLFIRCRNSGAFISGRKSYAVQFHLFHAFRKPKPDAEAWYQERLGRKDYVRCADGLFTRR